jgi:hypothetical protein
MPCRPALPRADHSPPRIRDGLLTNKVVPAAETAGTSNLLVRPVAV